jgi:hypothetical protein
MPSGRRCGFDHHARPSRYAFIPPAQPAAVRFPCCPFRVACEYHEPSRRQAPCPRAPVRRAPCAVPRAPCPVPRAPCPVRRAPCAVPRAPCLVRRASCAVPRARAPNSDRSHVRHFMSSTASPAGRIASCGRCVGLPRDCGSKLAIGARHSLTFEQSVETVAIAALPTDRWPEDSHSQLILYGVRCLSGSGAVSSGQKAPPDGAFRPEPAAGRARSRHTGRTLGRERASCQSGITTRRKITFSEHCHSGSNCP